MITVSVHSIDCSLYTDCFAQLEFVASDNPHNVDLIDLLRCRNQR